MDIRTVTDAIRYVGADDNTLALFDCSKSFVNCCQVS